jgi:flagellar hook-associated protein 3 FlgL
MMAMAKLQEQASSGSRVNRASDDPTGSYQILGLKSQQELLGNYIDNISSASDTLQSSDTIVQNIKQSLAQVRNVLSQVTSGTYSDDARARTAEQVDQILEQVVQYANSKSNGQYLFGGTSTGTAPYTVERTDGKITGVVYNGASGERSVEVAPAVTMNIFSVGEDIFGSNDRSAPVFSNVTGAKAGTGTSNVNGDVWLTVINDGSNYKVSIDDGLTYTTVPAGGEANQAVTDSRTGKVLYVDTTGINQTGVELVRVPGTYDVFNTLIAVRDTLKNDKGLSTDQLKQACNSAYNSLDEVINRVLQTSVTNGTKINFLDDLKTNLTDLKNQAEDQTSAVEDADIAQISIDLSRQQVLYQMSLSVAAKMMSISLLDYISTSTTQ